MILRAHALGVFSILVLALGCGTPAGLEIPGEGGRAYGGSPEGSTLIGYLQARDHVLLIRSHRDGPHFSVTTAAGQSSGWLDLGELDMHYPDLAESYEMGVAREVRGIAFTAESAP